MSIISLKFVIFVLGLLFLYYIMPKKYRWLILLFGSVIFYYLSSKKLIVFVLLNTIVTFFTALIINKTNDRIKNVDKEDIVLKKKLTKRKKIILLLGVLINIGFIIFTKYINFVIINFNSISNIVGVGGISKVKDIILPLGISYYTLESIGYMTDVYRGKYNATRNIFKLALFLMYFPKITEGPFSRFDDFGSKVFDGNSIDFNNITIGFDLILWGLFKKMVIADRAGIFVNAAFDGSIGGFTTILAMILYTLEIYAEFSGCIDIIRGVSMLFGIKLPANFRRPFFSKSIQEFWKRWHISLGEWIKDYVFFPISFSKMNSNVTKWSKNHLNNYFYKFMCAAFPLFFVWIVNGIWHGASYKYIAYGMYYYVLMMIGLLVLPLFKNIKINKYIQESFQVFRTIIIVIIGMTLFRAKGIKSFVTIISSIFGATTPILNYGLVKIDFIIIIISVILLLIVSILEEKKVMDIDEGFTKSIILRSLVYSFLILAIVIFGIYGEGYDLSNFIYGSF